MTFMPHREGSPANSDFGNEISKFVCHSQCIHYLLDHSMSKIHKYDTHLNTQPDELRNDMARPEYL